MTYTIEEMRNWLLREWRSKQTGLFAAYAPDYKAAADAIDSHLDQIERANAGLSDEVVERALNEFYDWNGVVEESRDDAQHRIGMRAALQAVAHLLPRGEVVVTKNDSGQIVAVTR